MKDCPLEDGYWERSPCWIWKHEKDKQGRAVVCIEGKMRYAADVVYEQNIGPIPEGEVVCSTCDCPACVNPDHLFTAAAEEMDFKLN